MAAKASWITQINVMGQRWRKEVERGIYATSAWAVVERPVKRDLLLIRTVKRHKCRAPAVTDPLQINS